MLRGEIAIRDQRQKVANDIEPRRLFALGIDYVPGDCLVSVTANISSLARE